MGVPRARAASGPLVLPLDDPDLQRALRRLAGGGEVRPLGGTMSRNLHLVEAGQVLRVHAPFVSRARVTGERRLRRALLGHGLLAARPDRVEGRELFEVAGRVAELEQHVPHEVPPPTRDAYQAMFVTLARIHRALGVEAVPRPVVSTYGAPGTLRRHLALLARRDLRPRSRQRVLEVAVLVHRLERSWVPARELPLTVVHGDARLENLPIDPAGRPVVLDLGFAAHRPRVHDLAYAAAWMTLGPDDAGEELDVPELRRCVAAYEEAAAAPLTALERQAFGGYLAGVCLYQSTIAAYVPDPDALLAQPGPRQMVAIARGAFEPAPLV